MHTAWQPEPLGTGPLFARLARGVVEDIRRGRLRPGDRLPGSRTLAERTGAHRNTVLAALRQLEAEGWVRSEPARGVFVAAGLPPASPPPSCSAGSPGFELHPAPPSLSWRGATPGMLWMAGGQPDLRLLPLPELARAYRRALRIGGRRLLDYGDPRGEPALRRALAAWLGATRGLALDADGLVVTRGSQQAIALLAQVLVRPGERVAVEALGYRPAWAAFRVAGAELVPIPVDGGGISTDAIEAAHAKAPLRAVYVTPHHQYPTGVPMAPGRRAALLAFAARARVPVIEDDYDNELHWVGRPILPLASADTAGVVLYVGTLSKAFAPGVRLGFVAAPAPVLERLAAARHISDRQGDRVVEAAIAELLDDGALVRHIRRVSAMYRSRRDVLLDALRSAFGDTVTVDPPPGGMALWCGVGDGAAAWARAARSHGVGVQPGQDFSFTGEDLPFLRLGFACLDEGEIREAVARLARARPLNHR